jgi:hypothetical protein
MLEPYYNKVPALIVLVLVADKCSKHIRLFTMLLSEPSASLELLGFAKFTFSKQLTLTQWPSFHSCDIN